MVLFCQYISHFSNRWFFLTLFVLSLRFSQFIKIMTIAYGFMLADGPIPIVCQAILIFIIPAEEQLLVAVPVTLEVVEQEVVVAVEVVGDVEAVEDVEAVGGVVDVEDVEDRSMNLTYVNCDP